MAHSLGKRERYVGFLVFLVWCLGPGSLAAVVAAWRLGAIWICFDCPLWDISALRFCAQYSDMPDDGSGKPRAHVRFDKG